MPSSVSLLQAKSRPLSTRDAIVSVLGERGFHSSKEIYSSLRREFGFNGTYQAMHKALGLLVEEKVAVKEAKKYSLSKSWVKNLKSYAESLEEQVIHGKALWHVKSLEEKGMANVTLVGIHETASFLIDYFFNLPNPQNKPSVALWRNVYSIIGLTETNYDGLKKTLPSWHAVSSEDNPLDRMFADTLRKYGMKIKLGVKEAATTLNDTFVTGDYVGTIWFPPHFRALWDEQNKLPKGLHDFDLRHHLQLMVDEKALINMVITKNEVLADQIREQYMKHFEEEKK